MSNFAVIDLGTNTFHLLIARPNKEGGFDEIYRERRFIKLAENGIQNIGDAAFKRGLKAMNDYAKIIEAHQVRATKAIGTAALRTASNGADFTDQVKADCQIEIELISGDEEARLIHHGVIQAVPFAGARQLIMDIGGGSVEFIIANKECVFWSRSFPIGVAVLFNQFHKNDPISLEEQLSINSFLQAQLGPLAAALSSFPVKNLIGASGTFDVLENLLESKEKGKFYAKMDEKYFHPFFKATLTSTLAERLKIDGIPPARAEMLIVALILIDYIISLADIQDIVVSAFAMKEGILKEMMK